jgi:hypothetical protein
MHTYISKVLHIISNNAFHALLHNKFISLCKIVPLAFFSLLQLLIFLDEGIFFVIRLIRTVLVTGPVSFLILEHLGVDQFVVHGGEEMSYWYIG